MLIMTPRYRTGGWCSQSCYKLVEKRSQTCYNLVEKRIVCFVDFPCLE